MLPPKAPNVFLFRITRFNYFTMSAINYWISVMSYGFYLRSPLPNGD